MDLDVSALEHEFRNSWRLYEPARVSEFVERVSEDSRPELLTRLLSAELEYFYQPPTLASTLADSSSDIDEEDERIQPRVRLFVMRYPQLREKPEYLMRLIVLEYALRLRYDPRHPNADSYLDLCYDRQDHLVQLLELTESRLHRVGIETELTNDVRQSGSTVKEEVSVPLAFGPLPMNLGCFLLTQSIGRGGMGQVFSAIDLRNTAPVAVKVMRRVDAWSVFRFNEEFSWLSKLSHPNLVRLYDTYSEGDLRYFSMELVEGQSVREWFRQLPNLDNRWESIRRLFAQIASAIHFLHIQGIIHRDVKCSNVMVTKRSRAILLDLGLAVRNDPESLHRNLEGERFIGTPQYMAPEVIDGGELSNAYDWYGLGVTLYETLTDGPPPIHVDLSQNAAGNRYRLQRTEIEDRLRDVPKDLVDLCLSLMNSSPSARPSGPEIITRLGSQVETTFEHFGKPECKGRAEQLAELDSALQLSTDSRCLVRLKGQSGIGKTTLVHHWLRNINASSWRVLSLRSYRQDHAPLRLSNSLTQELVRELSLTSRMDWEDAVQRYAKPLGKIFPQILQLAEIERRGPAIVDRSKSAKKRDSSLRALRELLSELSQKKPIVLVVDDAQWADNESIESLLQLLSFDSKFRGIVLLVYEDGSEAAVLLDQPHSEAQCSSQISITLGPLGEDTCRQLMHAWAQQSGTRLDLAVQRDLYERSQGIPFLLRELFRAYLEYSRNFANDDGWIEADLVSSTRRRFCLLPYQAEHVLQFIAVAAQPLTFHQLRTASKMSAQLLQRTLSHLSFHGWVHVRGMSLDTEIELSHENFRKIILESLPSERLERRHFRLARILSAENPPPWPRVAHHFWHARKFREAAACYMESARIAARDGTFQDAIAFLERADHPDAVRSDAEKLVALRLRADCLAGLGSADAAAQHYESLISNCQDPESCLLLGCLAGEHWIRAGQLHKGLELLRKSMSQLGMQRLSRSLLSQTKIKLRAFLIALRPVPESNSELTDQISFSPIEKSLKRVSTPLMFLDNQLGPELILRLYKLAFDHGSGTDRSHALAHSAVLLSFGGRMWRKVAIERLRRARSLARRIALPSTSAFPYLCLFVWSIQRGRHATAIRYCRKALELYERHIKNAQWEIQFLHWGLLGCYWNTGQLRQLRSATSRLRLSAQHRSDPMSKFWMNVGAATCSDLACDDAKGALAGIEVAEKAIVSEQFQSPRYFLWHSRISILLYRDQAEAAQALLDADWKELARSYVLSTNHYLWLALCNRSCANLLCARQQPERKRQWLAAAMASAKRLQKLEVMPFAEYGNGFKLVTDAARGNVAPQEQWSRLIHQVEKHNHLLFANAVRWHQSLYASGTQKEELIATARSFFDSEGCLDPERLLNIILPLPQLPSPNS